MADDDASADELYDNVCEAVRQANWHGGHSTDGEIAGEVVKAILANRDVVLRALGGERDDSRRTAFHDWWIIPTERTA